MDNLTDQTVGGLRRTAEAIASATATSASGFVRFQTPEPHHRREGVFLGIFAMVNTLGRDGRLTAEQEDFRRTTNQWFNENLPLPTEGNPALYSEAHLQSAAWFKRTAAEQLARIPGYLEILDEAGVGWHAIITDDPGPILYEDDF
ncbi:MAG: hypothetical protein ACK46X_21505, partial [Candidatus Sericytochromatia bacterium]